MSILFIGGIFSDEKKEEIIEKSLGNIQNAANNFQLEIIKGIEYWNKKPLDILNAIFVGSWPKFYKDKKIVSYKFSHIKNSNDYNIGFYNFKYLKHINRAYEVKKNLFKWLEKNKKTENKIYVYSYHVPFLFAVSMAKKKYKNLEVCLIVPDLPQYMNLSNKKNILDKFIKFIDIKVGQLFLKDIDAYILLTDYMKEKLKIKDKKYDIVEGIASSEDTSIPIIKEDINKKFILYTGTLDEKYGILTLIESMKYLSNTDLELWICGEGDSKNKIIEESTKNLKIKYKGILRVNEVRELQRQATLLVNPRSEKEEYTKYSFPSKTLEYMLSGTPILMNKLKGIPKDYYEYIYLIESDNGEEWAFKIQEILKKESDELSKIGNKAKKFALEKKNYIVQGEKIFNILN